jgi:hypothetical protein
MLIGQKTSHADFKIMLHVPSVGVHTCNDSTWKLKAEGAWVWDQPGVYSETCLKQQQQQQKTGVGREKEASYWRLLG